MPLTKQQQAEIKAGLKKAEESLAAAKADYQTAKRAGIDVSAQEAQLRELETQLRRMKAVYGE